jgi:hypothetical protein
MTTKQQDAVDDATAKESEVAPPAPAAPPEEPFDRAMRILRLPFPDEQVGRLPRAVRKDDSDKYRCEDGPQGRQASADGYFCGGYHTRSVHLSYVGHAALTEGLPLIQNGGLWIRLKVAGVTRLGYGDAPGKRDATKELIGDALRNAAMRFGAALDLWSKEDLRASSVEPDGDGEVPAQGSQGGGVASPSARPVSGAPASQQTAPVAARPIDEEVRSQWRTRVLSIEYLGSKPKEKRDGGLRTAYADATREGIVTWAVVPGQDETFLQLFGRLSKELPEWPDESKDQIPVDETEEQRVERVIAEEQRAAERDAQPPVDRPMALGGDDPWASAGQGEAGWGNTGAGA